MGTKVGHWKEEGAPKEEVEEAGAPRSRRRGRAPNLTLVSSLFRYVHSTQMMMTLRKRGRHKGYN